MIMDCRHARGSKTRPMRLTPSFASALVALLLAPLASSHAQDTASSPSGPASGTKWKLAFGDEFDGILQKMGATVSRDEHGLTVTGTGTIHGIDIDLSIGGELTPVVAALAALADSPTRISGVAHLRGHETDRLAALTTEINRAGGNCRETEDGLAIEPSSNLHGCDWLSYEDHRMATAGAIMGLRVPGIRVENIGTTAKTMPEFTQLWAKLLGASA